MNPILQPETKQPAHFSFSGNYPIQNFNMKIIQNLTIKYSLYGNQLSPELCPIVTNNLIK